MVVDKIAGALHEVLIASAKGVKGVVPQVLRIPIDVVSKVLEVADITPKQLYEILVDGGKPFAQIGMKEQVIYYTTVAVIKEVSSIVNAYEGEKEDMQKELEEAKVAKVDNVAKASVDTDVAIDWAGLQAGGGQPIV